MADEFKVTDQGITNRKLPFIRTLLVEMYKARYGDDAQTASDSYDGLLIDILSLIVQMLQEGIVGTYNNRFFRTAAGNAVDLILDLFQRKRLAAKASTASLVFYGSNGTLVPSATRASVAANERAFASDEDVTLVDQGLPAAEVTVLLIDDVQSAVDVKAQVTGYPEASHTVVPADTNETVRDDLVTQLNLFAGAAVAAFAGGTDENGKARLVIDHKVAGQAVTTATPAQVDIKAAGRVAATCTVTGAITASAGQLDIISTPVFGVDGVTTTADAIIGRARETDAEFKARHLRTLRSGGLSTPLAIRDRVLEQVLTTIEGKVFENESDITDANGVPGHHFEAVFLSEYNLDPSLPNDEDEILAQILYSKPAGIGSYGDINKVLIDGQGFAKDVAMSRPDIGYLHQRITLTPGEGFPDISDPAAELSLKETLKTEIAAFLARGGGGELVMGKDYVRFQVSEVINQTVEGVQTALIESDSTPLPADIPTYVDQDISVDDRAILVADSSRIEIIIL